MTLLLLGLFGGLIHLGEVQVRSFENSAAADIASKLQGPAKQVRVKADVGLEALWGDVCSVDIQASKFSADGLPLYTESKRSHRGLVRSLHIGLSDFDLRDLHVQRLSADIPNCRFDFPLAVNHRQIRLSESGTGEGEVVIGETDLEKFILSKFQEIKRVHVRIDRDKIFVDGYGEFLVVTTNFSVVARLEAPEGDKLMLARARILFDGKAVDAESQRLVLEAMNPIVDLNKDLALFGAIAVEGIELRNGLLVARGQVHIPEAPIQKAR
jgi:hypothetical protein